MADLDMNCLDCKNPFYFSERDQEFYKEQGFTPPKRCYSCRQKRKSSRVKFSSVHAKEYDKSWDDGSTGSPPSPRTKTYTR